MDELIARLEAATGPSRELDLEIAKSIGAAPQDADEVKPTYEYPGNDYTTPHWRNRVSAEMEHFNKTGELLEVTEHRVDETGSFPCYTSSIDAAMTLRPDGANCHGFDLTPEWAMGYWSRNNVSGGHWIFEAYGKTPAIALCIAALKARKQP
jgi:hypothetical protein